MLIPGNSHDQFVFGRFLQEMLSLHTILWLTSYLSLMIGMFHYVNRCSYHRALEPNVTVSPTPDESVHVVKDFTDILLELFSDNFPVVFCLRNSIRSFFRSRILMVFLKSEQKASKLREEVIYEHVNISLLV